MKFSKEISVIPLKRKLDKKEEVINLDDDDDVIDIDCTPKKKDNKADPIEITLEESDEPVSKRRKH